MAAAGCGLDWVNKRSHKSLFVAAGLAVAWPGIYTRHPPIINTTTTTWDLDLAAVRGHLENIDKHSDKKIGINGGKTENNACYKEPNTGSS